jgi:hypothetical protein
MTSWEYDDGARRPMWVGESGATSRTRSVYVEARLALPTLELVDCFGSRIFGFSRLVWVFFRFDPEFLLDNYGSLHGK